MSKTTESVFLPEVVVKVTDGVVVSATIDWSESYEYTVDEDGAVVDNDGTVLAVEWLDSRYDRLPKTIEVEMPYNEPDEPDPMTPVDAFTTDEMCRFARQRAVVLLDSGKTARLVRWPGDFTSRRPEPNRVRVEFRPGSFASVPTESVVAVYCET